MAVCLSLSIVSLGMAGFALLQSTQGDGPSRSDEVIENTSAEAAQEIRELAANLRGDAEELRLRIEKLESIAARSLKGGKKGKAVAGSREPDLAADIAALAERLEILESDENIAELARSGFARARKQETEDALSLVLDASQAGQEGTPPLATISEASKRRRLLDSSGTPVEGELDVSFRLHTEESGGSAAWEDAEACVARPAGVSVVATYP